MSFMAVNDRTKDTTKQENKVPKFTEILVKVFSKEASCSIFILKIWSECEQM